MLHSCTSQSASFKNVKTSLTDGFGKESVIRTNKKWGFLARLTALDRLLIKVQQFAHIHFLQKGFKSEIKLNDASQPSYQGYELSLLHDGLELLAPLGARSHLSAEQIPR